MTSALELRQVSKVYGSGAAEVHALREIDLSVERGELVAVMGPANPADTPQTRTEHHTLNMKARKP